VRNEAFLQARVSDVRSADITKGIRSGRILLRSS